MSKRDQWEIAAIWVSDASRILICMLHSDVVMMNMDAAARHRLPFRGKEGDGVREDLYQIMEKEMSFSFFRLTLVSLSLFS